MNKSSLGQWADQHRGLPLPPEHFDRSLGQVTQKVASVGNATSPEVMQAIRNMANKMADTKPVGAKDSGKAGYALPAVKVAEYAVQNVPSKEAPVIELDQPTDELQTLRSHRDQLGGVQQQAEIDDLRKRLAIQNLTKK